MCRWITPQEWIRKHKPKKDFRDVLREKYGDGFVYKYDLVNMGMPIGDIAETRDFLDKVEAAKMEVQDIKSVTMREGDTDADGFFRKAFEAVMEVQE